MATGAAAYLVIAQDDGFGDVFPLSAGERYTLGRAITNRIVLKDEVCSREHAEVYFADGRWRLRDLNSLNGTRINEDRLDSEWELSPRDEIHVGRTTLVFVDDIAELPDVPVPAPTHEAVTIKKRLRETRFLTPIPPEPSSNGAAAEAIPQTRRGLAHDLALLYRLAIDMGSAGSYEALARTVLKALLDAVHADAGAILTLKEDGELELTEHLQRDPTAHDYMLVSQFLSREVLTSREAMLAEDIEQHPDLIRRESLQEVGARSLICAPILFNEQVLGLVHLYCTKSRHALDADDLEFVMAVAKQFGTAAHNVRRQGSLTAENRNLRDQLRYDNEMVGSSMPIKKIESQIEMVARTNATVLIRGESGTGKELVTRAIHYSSQRKEGPFVCLNCAALPESLLESELFGHEKGAFTGATEKKVGKFEAAHRGTLFLDEIGEMNMASQAKLLRVLEGHPFERIGGHTPIKVDVRVVAATNQPLEKNLHAGTFRRDLFFRLQVVEIVVPPLRERRGDIRPLAEYFLKRFLRETGRKVHGFTPAAVKKLEEYDWPGNVRELRNVIERAVALGFGPMFDAQDIWLSTVDLDDAAHTGAAEFQPISLEEMERQQIQRTLQHTDWNKSQAATILKIERSTLDRKIKLYDLKR